MAVTSLNMEAVSRGVFPSLVTAIGPVLRNSIKVENVPGAKSTVVNIFAERTGAEFTQATANYTSSPAATTGVTVTFTEVYDYIKQNKLVVNQTPVDFAMAAVPVMGRAIAKKMFAMQNALVLAATYTNTAITSTAANWDADDMADAATGLDVALASEQGRYAVLTPTYTGALSKDNAIQAAYAFGDDGVIKRNVIPNVHGFEIAKVSSVAASGDVANLVGWLAAPEAFAVGFRPSFENADFGTSALIGSYTDPATGITITTKFWDGNDGNYHIWAGLGFGISAGQAAALTILKSA